MVDFEELAFGTEVTVDRVGSRMAESAVGSASGDRKRAKDGQGSPGKERDRKPKKAKGKASETAAVEGRGKVHGMTRMLSRRTWARPIVAGSDGVLFGIWLPPGSAVHRLSGMCGVESDNILVAQQMCLGSVEGWVFNVDDLDNLGTMDTEFDIHVPKDNGVQDLDLDAATADTKPFYEPGEIAWEFLFPIGRQPERVFQKRWMSYLGHNNALVNQDPETPFGFQFIGGTTFGLSVRRPFRLDDPSLLVFGLASPDTLQTSSTKAIEAIAERDWGRLRYIDHILEQAMVSLLGITEAGAETPWDEAVLLLEEVLDPPVFETGSGNIVPVTWRSYGEVIIDFSVEGTMPKAMLTTGR